MAEDEKAERPPRLVRFDFPPGAGSKEIAEAIEAARRRIMAEWAKRNEQKEEDAG